MELPDKSAIMEELLKDPIVKNFDDTHWLVRYLSLDESYDPWDFRYSTIEKHYFYKNKSLDLAISRYFSMCYELITKPKAKILETNLTSITVEYKDGCTYVKRVEIRPVL